MGTTLFDHARNNFDAARRNAGEALDGIGDVLRADARFLRGEQGFVETLRQEAAGYQRAQRGATDAVLRGGVAAAAVVPYGVLPPLVIVDMATNPPQREEKESMAAREIKDRKHEVCPPKGTVEKQKPQSEIQQESGSSKAEDRVHVVRPGQSIWEIVAEDYKRHHNGEINNRIINERKNALVAIHGETIHPGQRIQLPEQP